MWQCFLIYWPKQHSFHNQKSFTVQKKLESYVHFIWLLVEKGDTQLPLSQKDKNNCMLSETVVHIHVLQLVFIP